VAATGRASARLPLSRASPNGSAMCGGDWHCQCAPPGVSSESVGLRGVWRRLTLPVRASRRRGRVRTAPHDMWRRPAGTLANISGRKLSSDHVWASDKIFLLKGVAEEHLAASSHGPFVAAFRRHKAQAKALPRFCLATMITF